MSKRRGRPARAGERASRVLKATATHAEALSAYAMAQAEGCSVSDIVRIALMELAAARGVEVEMPLTRSYHRTGFGTHSLSKP